MAVLGALGDLVLALSADTAKFQSDLGRAQRVADKFGRDVGRALGNVAGALLALGGAAGFTGLIRGQIDAADAANKLSQKVGLSTEALSAYMVQARLSDVANEQLQTGLQQLAKNQADFVAGTGEAADAFRALGISQQEVKDLNGDTAALFELIAGKMAQFEDGANKTAIAMKIFGRSGAELIPLINSLQETRNEAQQLGALLDKDTAAAAERFNDNLTRVGVTVQAVGLNMARVLLPTLEKYSESMVEAAKNTEAMNQAGRVADTALKLIATGGTIVSSVFEIVGKSIGNMAAVVDRVLSGQFSEAFRIAKDGVVDAGTAVGEAAARIETIWDEAGARIEKKAPEAGKKLAAPALVAAKQVKNATDEIRKQVLAAEQVLGIDPDTERQREEDRKRQEEDEKKALEDKAQMWKQVFETIDAEQAQAIEDGQALIETTKEQNDVARDLGLTFESAFEEAVVGGKKLSDVLRGLAQDVLRVFARKTVTEPIANAASSLFSGLIKDLLPKFDVGTPYVPQDMVAMVHKGEAIVPAAQNKPGALGGITVVQNNSFGAGVSRAEIAPMLEQVRRAAIDGVAEACQRGGVYAAAVRGG